MVRKEGERGGIKTIRAYKEDVEVRTRREKKEEAERKKRPEDGFPHSKRRLKLNITGKTVVWQKG